MLSSPSSPPTEPPLGAFPRDPDRLPSWHTAALVTLIVGVAVAGTLLFGPGEAGQPPSVASRRVLSTYLPILGVQWGLAFYVCRVGRSRSALWVLLGERWCSAKALARDVALAACGWLAIEGFELLWRAVAGRGAAAGSAILPHTALDRALWLVVAVSVGISEELVYRGYLQARLTAFTRSASGGVVLQAALFGMAHLDQGPAGAARVFCYGLAFGALARWRRSLLPGILCHVMTDLMSGWLPA